MKDPLILYYKSPEFKAYFTIYKLALECEAERILLYHSHGLAPLARAQTLRASRP